MKAGQVYSGFAVSGQMQPEDLEVAADEGFVAIICNRPDGEEADQPTVDDLRAAAYGSGLAFHHIPVRGGQFSLGAVRAFAAVRKGTQGAVLAFCRA